MASSHIDQTPLPGRTALILYGSETGNAQDIAEELGRLAQRLRFSTRICDLNSIDLGQLVRASVVIFAISTTGQGDLPANATSFWRTLRSKRLQPGCLKPVHFTTFGLGDSSYLQFNWASRKLYNRLIQLGAQPFFERGESDEQHPEGIEGTFLPWYLKVREALLNLHPLPQDVVPIPDNVLLQPKWELAFMDGEAINNDTALAPSPELSEDLPPNDSFPIPNTFTTTLLSNTRLTPKTHWQDVRHLSFSLPPNPYEPGDVLVIHPKNFPGDVSNLLTAQSWTSIADRPVHLRPMATDPPPPPIPSAPADRPYTLRSILTNALDIMAIPRRSFFSAIQHYTSDDFQKDRLIEFTDPQYIDELYDYTTRPRRSILEVLQEFDTVRLPWQRVFEILPRLRGRQFSVASGGALKNAPAQTQIPSVPRSPIPATSGVELIEKAKGEDKCRVELLIAIVKYRTVIKRIRQGVCTRYISSLTPGTTISVSLQKGALRTTSPDPADIARPVVMIGPGTGVAPMRALVWERVEQAKHQRGAWGGTDLLFYGCRNENADFFFKEEWEELRASGKWRGEVFAAFSRDQRLKVYVQDLVWTEREKVFEALVKRGGMVYICGSSGKMPQAVREALIEVFQSEGSLDRDGAEKYLVSMEKAGRYKQETW